MSLFASEYAFFGCLAESSSAVNPQSSSLMYMCTLLSKKMTAIGKSCDCIISMADLLWCLQLENERGLGTYGILLEKGLSEEVYDGVRSFTDVQKFTATVFVST
jgi:hypothetical protein